MAPVKRAVSGLWAQGTGFSVCSLLARYLLHGKQNRRDSQNLEQTVRAHGSDPLCFLFAKDNSAQGSLPYS